MIQIISGTDRPGSKTLQICEYMRKLYEAEKADVEILDLAKLNLADVAGGNYWGGAKGTFKTGVDKVNNADGLLIVAPEYNGSYPGILKLFIDYWEYPRTFDNRPVAFIGLGTRWGGLRTVEHLQQVMGYRNAFVFPHRVFVTNVKENFKDGELKDPMMAELAQTQTREFIKYMRALRSENLDALGRKKP